MRDNPAVWCGISVVRMEHRVWRPTGEGGGAGMQSCDGRRCRDVGEYRSVVMEGRRMKEELDTVKEDQVGETRSSCFSQ